MLTYTRAAYLMSAVSRTAVVLTYDGTSIESIPRQGIVIPLRVLLVNWIKSDSKGLVYAVFFAGLPPEVSVRGYYCHICGARVTSLLRGSI